MSVVVFEFLKRKKGTVGRLINAVFSLKGYVLQTQNEEVKRCIFLS